jgi:hypothetical protein
MVYRNRSRNRRGCGLSGLFSGFFLLGMGLLFIWIFIYPTWRARLSGVETRGTVVSLDVCQDSGGDMVLQPTHALKALEDNVKPTIRFTDQQGHTHEVDYSFCGTYEVGETISLWYVPDDPGSVFVPGDMVPLIIATILLGGLAIVGLLLVLVLGGRFLFLLGAGAGMVFQGNRAASYTPQMGASQSSSGSKNHRIGQPVTVEGRWSVLPTRAYPSQGDRRATPAPGRYFLMLMITLRNISQEPLYPGQGMFHLYDNLGTEYTRVQVLESPLQGHIQPGGTAALTLAFDVASTQRQFRLSYASSTTLLTEASWDVAI